MCKRVDLLRVGFTTVAVMILVATGFMFQSCRLNRRPVAQTEVEETEDAIFAVNTYVTKAGNFDTYLEFGGDISAVSAVDVLPDVAGKVSRILVGVGDRVSKNQIIAYVDASRPGMEYAESPVKSPVSGTVISFTPTVGMMVSQQVSVAKISNTNNLQILVNVPERFVSRIHNGQKAEVTLDAYPGDVFDAKVFEVSPVIDAASRTMSIKLKFSGDYAKVRAGMYCRVKLITDSFQNVIVVPSNAVVSRDGENFIFVANRENEKSTVRLVKILPGITVDDKTEIREGLKAGDEVIVKGQSLLNDGVQVNIVAAN